MVCKAALSRFPSCNLSLALVAALPLPPPLYATMMIRTTTTTTTVHPRIRGQWEVVFLDHHWREVCQRMMTPHLIYFSINSHLPPETLAHKKRCIYSSFIFGPLHLLSCHIYFLGDGFLVHLRGVSRFFPIT